MSDAEPPNRERSAPPAAEGVLLFARDGRLLATSTGQAGLVEPFIGRLADLEARYRQSDGMPVHLRERGRQVGLPVDPAGSRVLLVSEPVSPVGDRRGDAALAVSIIPFRDAEDPQTVQTALSSVLAHELRTPMTTVYAGAQLLASGGLSEAMRADAARAIALAAEGLHRTVEDLVLLVHRSTDDLGEVGPVLLLPVLRREIARRTSPEMPIEVILPGEVAPVLGTDAAIEHLVRNVLDRAIRNASPRGHVRVDARSAGAWVEVRVTDSGPGWDGQQRDRAFELFGSTGRHGADPSGANLSMVVARRLVERLGGRIELGSPADGAGTILTLPAAVDASDDVDDPGSPMPTVAGGDLAATVPPRRLDDPNAL